MDNTLQHFYSHSARGFFNTEIHALDGMPLDVVEITAERHAELMEAQAAGQVIVPGPDGLPVAFDRPPLTPQQQASALRRAVQRHLEDKAREYGYDSILSAVSYADCNSVPIYQEEGQEFRHWRSMVWAAVDVALRQGALPTADELILTLPELSL